METEHIKLTAPYDNKHNVIEHNFIKGTEIIGTIKKNPYTGIFEALKMDWLHETYVKKEFNKFENAKQYILE